MKNIVIALSTLLLAVSASADLSADFREMSGLSKGPFGDNVLQGAQDRVRLADSMTPPANFQFQAAFRNETARRMSQQSDFYVGNLFTTNYYELMGEYVYNDAYGSHALDHAALLTGGHQARAKAASMLRHWVLEKHYVSKLPNSRLANSFKMRGISGTEFEQQYAGFFFNFYLSILDDDFQYLPAYLLAKQSPIASSSSLDEARNLIAALYDEVAPAGSTATPVTRELYRLRNMIHNQLALDAVAQMNAFARANPTIGADPKFVQVKNILAEYFNIDASKVVAAARRAGANSVKTIAEQIVASGASTARLLALSQELANLRTSIANNNAVPSNKKTDTLVTIITGSQYLNKELTALARVTTKEPLQTVLNIIYAEGFLIKDNADYFTEEITSAANLAAALTPLTSAIAVAEPTLALVFPAATADGINQVGDPDIWQGYIQWSSLEAQMASFYDNSLKSSALATAAQLIEKAGR